MRLEKKQAQKSKLNPAYENLSKQGSFAASLFSKITMTETFHRLAISFRTRAPPVASQSVEEGLDLHLHPPHHKHTWRLASIKKTVCAWRLPSTTALCRWTFCGKKGAERKKNDLNNKHEMKRVELQPSAFQIPQSLLPPPLSTTQENAIALVAV